VYKSARIISLVGRVVSTSQVGRRIAEHTLDALCSDPNVLYTLFCSEETGALSAQVELDTMTQVTQDRGGFGLTFALQVAAPDPRKYGQPVTVTTTLSSMSGGLDWATGGGLDWTGAASGGLVWGLGGSSGSVQVNNTTGTADIWPTFTLAANGGTLVNPSITHVATGQVLSLNWTLAGTDSIVIVTNPIGRSVILNSTADRRSSMTSAQWWNVPAGTSTMEQFQASSSTGAPTLSATYAPGFW
jgi:hypothetical protein